MCLCKTIKNFLQKRKNIEGDSEGKMIDIIWSVMRTNPEKIYYTETNLPFKVIMDDHSFRVRRITPNGDFIVKQELKKENLGKAISMRPTQLSDINQKIRGASYCYAIIKEYKNILWA